MNKTTGNGCRVHPNCLECPLETCVLELPTEEGRVVVRRHQAQLMQRRVQSLMEQGLSQREAVQQLAEEMDVSSVSNIYRRLKQHRGEN